MNKFFIFLSCFAFGFTHAQDSTAVKKNIPQREGITDTISKTIIDGNIIVKQQIPVIESDSTESYLDNQLALSLIHISEPTRPY